ncbi:MerR family transcriptional regulator [Thalassococcus sp. S3]|uniref:MerR family transcriptional regulator n=1 Tax=Thalassococcus sp. S3 TaxID=2017482 RepID=UPI001023FD75|nr:MerR family transcriptional regulator [Thalassococcus sp. S3]QBF33085.1 MerR family transcriptional regulator [Thalassococcus sp. S3]
MKIAEVSQKSGLSSDTIRYYESCGMLPDIRRSPQGHREFTPKDVEWLTLLYWLRETGMPLRQMKRFTALAKMEGPASFERRHILMDHAEELRRRRAVLDHCEKILAIKIASYGPDRTDPA